MQAVLSKCQKSLSYCEDLEELISVLSATNKNEIENKIVKMGENVVELLVDKLPSLKGIARGVVAMSLIRIGEASLAPLKEHKDLGWIADYLIYEISR